MATIILKCPVKKTVWGKIDSYQDLYAAIQKSGQPFGVDWSGVASNYDSSYPSDQTLYEYKGWGLHSGIDIPVSTGTEVYATSDSKVYELSDRISQGIGVVLYDPIQHLKTIYWHLRSFNVVLGQEVKAGELIGLSNNTGYSAGPHLHFAVKHATNSGNSGQSFDPMPCFVWDNENMQLTKEQIEKIYALWGLNDLEGVEYWVGKELDALLNARIRDELNQLKKYELS